MLLKNVPGPQFGGTKTGGFAPRFSPYSGDEKIILVVIGIEASP